MRAIKLLSVYVAFCLLVLSCNKPDSPGNGPGSGPGPVNFADTTSNLTVYVAGNNAKLYAYNAKDGSVKWTFALASSSPGYGQLSSPVLVDSTIYIGSMNKNIYAINANTGVEKWHYTTGSANNFFSATPLVANGKVYVGGNENIFNALDAQTGQLVWSKSFTREFQASAAYENGVVFVACVEGGLYALDANTGTVKWLYSPFGHSFGINCPKVKAGVIYIQSEGAYSGSSPWIQPALHVINASNAGPVNGRSGCPLPFDFTTPASPSIEDSIVYVGGYDSSMYAINTKITGADNKLWKYKTGGIIVSSPIYADSLVYVSGEDDCLHAVNRFTGALRWKFRATPYGSFRIFASPVVANGVVFIGTASGLFALDALTGEIRWRAGAGIFFETSPCILSKQGKIFHSNVTGMKN